MLKNHKSVNLPYILVILCVALSYTYLHFTLNIEYHYASWKALYSLNAPVPFGNRVLIPILSRPLVMAGTSIRTAFMFWEFASCIVLAYSLFKTFSLYLNKTWSKAFSLTFFLFLPPAFLLQFQYPIFYPYDTPAMALTVLCLFLILTQRWLILVLIVVISTLNRESSILVPLMFAALYADKMETRKFIRIFLLLLAAYIVVRLEVMALTRNNPHPYGGQVGFTVGQLLRVTSNLKWMKTFPKNPLILLGSVSFTPVLVFFLRNSIPRHILNLALVCGIYVCALLFIGNIFEPRIFGEVLSLSYIMIILGLYSSISRMTLSAPNDTLRSTIHVPLKPMAIYLQKYGWYILALAFVSAVIIMEIFREGFFPY